jgi:predicted lipid-binding transport protein (Tim44 family)
MAKSREGEQNTRSAGKENGPLARAEPGGLLGRLGGLLVPLRRYVDVPATSTKSATARNQQNGATPAPARPQRSPMSRFLFGMMIFFVGTYVLQIILILINGYLGLHLERIVVYHFPKGFPGLGGSSLNEISLIYFGLIIVFLWLLYRFNIMPKDPFGARAAAAQRNAARAAPPSDGNRRSAAARRAKRASQASATTKAPSAAKASARPVTTPTRRAPVQPASTKSADGSDDEVYERVKALQRSRRRKK